MPTLDPPPAPLPPGGNDSPSAPVAPLAPGQGVSPGAPPAPLAAGQATSPSAPPAPLESGGYTEPETLTISGTIDPDLNATLPKADDLDGYSQWSSGSDLGSIRVHATNISDVWVWAISQRVTGAGGPKWRVEWAQETPISEAPSPENSGEWVAAFEDYTGSPIIEINGGGPASPPQPFPAGQSSSPVAPPDPLGAGQGVSPSAPPAPLTAGAGLTPTSPPAPLAPGRTETPPSPPQPI